MAKLLITLMILFELYSVLCGGNIIEYEGHTHLPGYDLKGMEREYREHERQVERPCPVYDMLCIRRYLSRHSNCKIAEGPVPDPLYRSESNAYIPASSITVTQSGLGIGGLTGTVSEFSINRNSRVTVLKVDFKNVTVTSGRIFIRFHRRAQEPAVTSSALGDAIFPSLSITTVFKGIDHLSLADSESVAFLDVLGEMLFGPELGENSDPTITQRYANLLSNLQALQLEAFLTAAPFFAGTYIQNALCDFGLKLS